MGAEWDAAPRLRHLSQSLLRPALERCWGYEVSGLEHLPEKGGVIIAAGPHLAVMDTFVLGLAPAPKRYAWGLGKVELFKVPVVGWYLRNAGTIAIERSGDVTAMKAALALLEDGGCLALFPEGTRSKTGERLPAKPGVGFMASRARVPVVPARVLGSGTFPWTRKVAVRFGPALRLDDPKADRAVCRAFGESVMETVFSL